jgi:hypothetical protein
VDRPATRRTGEADYRHRDVLDKLGVKPGQAVALESRFLGDHLRQRLTEQLGRALADPEDPLDLVLTDIDDASDPEAVLGGWRSRLVPTGAIWLFTRKRGQPGYVDQRELMSAGQVAGLVDNKVCSVSETISAMRFVIRRVDRR